MADRLFPSLDLGLDFDHIGRSRANSRNVHVCTGTNIVPTLVGTDPNLTGSDREVMTAWPRRAPVARVDTPCVPLGSSGGVGRCARRRSLHPPPSPPHAGGRCPLPYTTHGHGFCLPRGIVAVPAAARGRLDAGAPRRCPPPPARPSSMGLAAAGRCRPSPVRCPPLPAGGHLSPPRPPPLPCRCVL